jgi:hypothetical protein
MCAGIRHFVQPDVSRRAVFSQKKPEMTPEWGVRDTLSQGA